MPLNQRRKEVLKAIVDDYIMTSEPVGSKRLVENYDLGVSPATVRHEMATLESLGYLTSPHTSAGRVPSDLAYRVYVDQLMEVEPLPEEDMRMIHQSLEQHATEMMETLRSAAVVLSKQSGYASVTVTPRTHTSVLDQVKMLMIEPGKVLVVIVLRAGLVRDRLVRMPEYLGDETFSLIAATLQEAFRGQPIQDISLVAMERATEHVPIPDVLMDQVLYETYVSIKQADQLDTYIEGVPNLFRHPEFHQTDRAHRVIDALTTEGFVAGLMDEPASADKNGERTESKDGGDEAPKVPATGSPRSDYMIRIGDELQVQGLEDCSFVTTTYHIGEKLYGRIAVVGPKRMRYERVVSEIRFVRQTIHQLDRSTRSSDERRSSDESRA